MRLEEQGNGGMKTLFIDRDPDTFADICRHLQGTSVCRLGIIHTDRLGQDTGFCPETTRITLSSMPMHNFTASHVSYPNSSILKSSSL